MLTSILTVPEPALYGDVCVPRVRRRGNVVGKVQDRYGEYLRVLPLEGVMNGVKCFRHSHKWAGVSENHVVRSWVKE